MSAMDPATRELLAALVDLDARTRDADERERSTALAYLAGVLRGVVRGSTDLPAATATVAAYRLGRAEGTEWRVAPRVIALPDRTLP